MRSFVHRSSGKFPSCPFLQLGPQVSPALCRQASGWSLFILSAISLASGQISFPTSRGTTPAQGPTPTKPYLLQQRRQE